jgi:hypothetical protein
MKLQGIISPNIELCKLMYYPINLQFMSAFIRAKTSLTNDEWDLVDCRHCKTHNEPEHCP